MADGVNAIGNLQGRVDATGALVVGVDGSSALLFPLLAPNGTLAAPSYSFAAQPNTGFFHTGTGVSSIISATVNGTRVVQIDSAGGLYLSVDNAVISIGATSPVTLTRSAADRLMLGSGDSFYVPAGAIGVNTVPGAAGSVTATQFIGGGAGLTGITGATGGVSNLVNTNIVADSDNDGSGVIDFQTGITSKWQVVNAGHLVGTGTGVQLRASDGTAALPSITFGSDTDTGIYWPSTGVTRVSSNTVNIAQFDAAGFTLFSNSLFRMGDGTDLVLAREAANHWFQRNTTNAQRASWANTYASTVSYEAFSIDWQTVPSVAFVGTRTAATGTGRELRLFAQSTSGATGGPSFTLNPGAPFVRLEAWSTLGGAAVTSVTTGGGNLIQVAGALRSIDTTGSVVVFAITPTYNQAAATTANTDLLINRTQTAVGSGTQLLIDAQVGGVSQFSVNNSGTVTALANVIAPVLTSSGIIRWNSNGSRMVGTTDGVITLSNAAQNDFSRLQFGGTTAAFPALKRSSANLLVRLADDSAYAGMAAAFFVLNGQVDMRNGAGSPEGVVAAAVGSIYLRTDGGAGSTFWVKETGAATSTGWVAK